jgi:PiT family inorganic phosphate transporter
MGVIFLALLAIGEVSESDPIPWWVVAASAGAISLGTYSGGWRIMKTLGRRVIDLDPARGFAAESVASSILYTTAFVIAAPVSTTQTITGSIMGAGAEKRKSAVRWSVGKSIMWAWILTFPAAALFAAIAHGILLLVWPGA